LREDLGMTKADLEDMAQLYKDQVEFYRSQIGELRDMNKELRDQNIRLQEAIMAVRAPEAYRDLIADRIEPMNYDQEAVEKGKKISEIQTQHLANLENDLFKSADDMVQMLAPTLFEGDIGPASKSLHDNSES
jgi:hypothetical protein